MSAQTTVAVLGLGEAGGAIAADLAAGGARVVGWDPAGGDIAASSSPRMTARPWPAPTSC